MAGPTNTIEPSILWSVLSRAERPFRIVDFPREDEQGRPIGKLAIRVLTHEETTICQAAAEKFTREHLKDGKKDELGYEAVYSTASVIEVLFRACRDAEDIARPAFPSPKLLSQALTGDEVSVLFQNYLATQLELGPIIAQMTEAEMEAWIVRIGDGGSSFPLDLLSLELMRTLLHFSARRLASSRMANSSAGKPPDEATSEPENSSTSAENG